MLLKEAPFVIFSTSIIVLFEIHQSFKDHFSNKLRVFFKVFALTMHVRILLAYHLRDVPINIHVLRYVTTKVHR